MKTILLAVILVSALNIPGYGQCDKKVVVSSSKTEHLGSDSVVRDTKDEQTLVEFDKTNITVNAGSDDHIMTGTITSYICNWQTPFKEGKTVMKVSLTDDNHAGSFKNFTITIEGKSGKINFVAEMEDNPDKKIRLIVDKFEEKK